MKKVLYTSDLHGNTEQYQKLVAYAVESRAEAVIIGGDLGGGFRCDEKFLDEQRRFFCIKLPQILLPLRKKLPNSKVFLMMGNDDAAANVDVLMKKNHYWEYIHGRRVQLGNFDIVGYSCVPITPFAIKDWEKYDSDEDSLVRARLLGLKSAGTGWIEYKFDTANKSDNISKDLSDKIFTESPGKTVYVIHTPPKDTCLDQIVSGFHVGSKSVKNFIEQNNPYLSLHGHIHETVDMSGSFKAYVGKTLCMSAGNHRTGKLCLLEFDLDNPESAERKSI